MRERVGEGKVQYDIVASYKLHVSTLSPAG